MPIIVGRKKIEKDKKDKYYESIDKELQKFNEHLKNINTYSDQKTKNMLKELLESYVDLLDIVKLLTRQNQDVEK